MATVDYAGSCEFEFDDFSERTDTPSSFECQGTRRGLHRIAEVRRQQGVTLRTVARHLRLPVAEVRRQELAASDLRLSELRGWQQVLEVPVAELLVEAEGQLSAPVLERARMVKIMKTAAAIRERTRGSATGRLVAMLIDQIVELMPEIEGVAPWPEAGQRRTLNDLGRTAQFPVSEAIFES
ncbi:MAG: helix-turn-helix domain-containing protein [Planctomycetia bacterium]